MVPQDAYYFTLFPMGGAPPAVPPPPSPAVAPSVAAPPPVSLLLDPPPLIDAIQLSSDTESGVNGNEEETESEVQREDTIADRVAARRRAQFASFGDIL